MTGWNDFSGFDIFLISSVIYKTGIFNPKLGQSGSARSTPLPVKYFTSKKGGSMAISVKAYLRRWKKVHKKQVMVMLSKEAYEGLRKLQQLLYGRFSAIVDRFFS